MLLLTHSTQVMNGEVDTCLPTVCYFKELLKAILFLIQLEGHESRG